MQYIQIACEGVRDLALVVHFHRRAANPATVPFREFIASLEHSKSSHAATGKVLCCNVSEGHRRSDCNARARIGAAHNARHIVSYRI